MFTPILGGLLVFLVVEGFLFGCLGLDLLEGHASFDGGQFFLILTGFVTNLFFVGPCKGGTDRMGTAAMPAFESIWVAWEGWKANPPQEKEAPGYAPGNCGNGGSAWLTSDAIEHLLEKATMCVLVELHSFDVQTLTEFWVVIFPSTVDTEHRPLCEWKFYTSKLIWSINI